MLLPFTGSAKDEGDYTFKVSQTYSDGSVVDWAGSEDSDTPAVVVAVGAAEHGAEASHSDSDQDDRDHRARPGRARAGRRRRLSGRREALGMRVGGRAGALLVAFVVALAVPALAQGHATLLATQPQASGVLSQPRPRSASPTASASSRASRSSRHGCRREPGDRGESRARGRRRELDLRSREDPLPGLVPRVVARHLGGRAPGPRRVHVRRRAESRAAAAVRHPVTRRERSDAEPRREPLGAAARR